MCFHTIQTVHKLALTLALTVLLTFVERSIEYVGVVDRVELGHSELSQLHDDGSGIALVIH